MTTQPQATHLFRDQEHREYIAAGTTVNTGTVLVTPEGNCAVLQGLKAAYGPGIADYFNEDVWLVNKGATVFAEGDTVYWDPVNVVAIQNGVIRMGRCAQAAASGAATVAVRLLKDNLIARWSQTTTPATITNTTSQTAFASFPSIPANYLRVGDVIKVRARATVTTHNASDTLAAVLQIGGVTAASIAATNVAVNGIEYFDIEAVITAVGSSGAFTSAGFVAAGASGSAAANAVTVASGTIDTTSIVTVKVLATWSAASTSDVAQLDLFDVTIVRS